MTIVDMKSLKRNPELAFVDVELLDLRRELKGVGEWSRGTVACCVNFVAGIQEGDDAVPPRQASAYRKMLRRLIELERVPPPRRATVATGASSKSAVPG